MSFDLFLQRFDSGTSAQVDRAAVLSVLRTVCQQPEDRFGFYLVEFPDGSHVELSAKGLETDDEFTGCAFHLRGFSKSLIFFVYDIAVAGDMVIFNAQGRSESQAEMPMTILTSADQAPHLPSAVAECFAICSSGVQLAQLLGASIEDWEGYRDRVVGH
ncbi:hypothetical protein [Dyella mobilis]|uniref:Uncharacterized protein n=1 Tax=Dyella mobilis TaxID=1849582 RepID=A0ABS2KEF4_9GAMM|nr:hypothetical protein [Dyella mobilis]MBM7129562.1 hypothetical protein [Dyella mobilis]